MARRTRKYMVEAIDQTTRNMTTPFKAVDLEEVVSTLCGEPISKHIISRVLVRMAQHNYVKYTPGEKTRFPYTYLRVNADKFPYGLKGVKGSR